MSLVLSHTTYARHSCIDQQWVQEPKLDVPPVEATATVDTVRAARTTDFWPTTTTQLQSKHIDRLDTFKRMSTWLILRLYSTLTLAICLAICFLPPEPSNSPVHLLLVIADSFPNTLLWQSGGESGHVGIESNSSDLAPMTIKDNGGTVWLDRECGGSNTLRWCLLGKKKIEVLKF